jgi:hypothetical protein
MSPALLKLVNEYTRRVRAAAGLLSEPAVPILKAEHLRSALEHKQYFGPFLWDYREVREVDKLPFEKDMEGLRHRSGSPLEPELEAAIRASLERALADLKKHEKRGSENSDVTRPYFDEAFAKSMLAGFLGIKEEEFYARLAVVFKATDEQLLAYAEGHPQHSAEETFQEVKSQLVQEEEGLDVEERYSTLTSSAISSDAVRDALHHNENILSPDKLPAEAAQSVNLSQIGRRIFRLFCRRFRDVICDSEIGPRQMIKKHLTAYLTVLTTLAVLDAICEDLAPSSDRQKGS